MKENNRKTFLGEVKSFEYSLFSLHRAFFVKYLIAKLILITYL